MPTDIKQGHAVVVPQSLWGHTRPLLHLCLNLLTLHPNLRITFLLSPSAVPRIEGELLTVPHVHLPSGSEPPLISRLQLVKCVSADLHLPKEFSPETMMKEAMDYAAVMPAFAKDLCEGRGEVQGAENKFTGVPVNFVIHDLFQPFAPHVFKNVAAELGTKVPALIGFCPCNASAFFHHFASEEKGGFMAKMHRLAKADIAKGRDVAEAYDEYQFYPQGEVLALPGLPPKFDYEWWPLLATCPVPPGVVMTTAPSYYCVHDEATKGIILPSSADLEPESVKALEAELGKRMYMAGPQFPEEVWTAPPPFVPTTPDDKRVLAFLSSMSAKHGPKSVAYVSFGSLFFPLLRLELVQFILRSLRDAGVPFVFAYASGLAQVPEGLVEEFEGGEDYCLVKFAPQWGVLSHEATGFFVTHCGSNSAAEAIMTETPIVAMPFAGDQGQYASLLVDNLKVGLELKQVKTFANPSFTKLYDGTTIVGTEEAIVAEMKDVWSRMRGKEGEEMRERMSGVKGVLKKSWDGGRSRADMLDLGKCFE
ncbi:hypothetical protein IAT38_006325 [Cryptococcus sp. DSM 104549]